MYFVSLSQTQALGPPCLYQQQSLLQIQAQGPLCLHYVSLGSTLFTDTRDTVTDMTLGPPLSTESLPYVSSMFTDTELHVYGATCLNNSCIHLLQCAVSIISES